MKTESNWSEIRSLLQQKANLDTAAAIAKVLLLEEEDVSSLMVDYIREHASPLLRIMLFGVVQMTTNASPLSGQDESSTPSAARASRILSLLTRPA